MNEFKLGPAKMRDGTDCFIRRLPDDWSGRMLCEKGVGKETAFYREPNGRKCIDGLLSGEDVMPNNLPEPKWRKFTDEELDAWFMTNPVMVYKATRCKCRTWACAAGQVKIGDYWVTSAQLVDDYTLSDGSPCGVRE